MTRRAVLTLVELTLVTAALAASLGLLAHAANAGTVQWAAATFASVITALALLLPTTLALLLRAAWLGAPGAYRAVRARVQHWRQWRGIQIGAEPQQRATRPVPNTMAVRPRTAAAGRHR